MNGIVASHFQEPKPLNALNGALGLTSEQIALALGVRHDNVVRAVREYIALDPAFPHSEEKLMTGGRPKTLLSIPALEARVIVAQYRSKAGVAYVRYLIEFEKRARELEPELRAAFSALEEEVATLRTRLEATSRPRALPPARTQMVTEVLTHHDSLMGDGPVIERHMVRVERASLSPLEVKKAKRVMLVLQAEGIAKAIRKLSDEIDFQEQPPAQRLRVVKEAK